MDNSSTFQSSDPQGNKRFRPKTIPILVAIGVLLLGIQIVVSFFPGTANAQSLSDYIPYSLEAPDQKFKLPGKLKEISGLSFWNDSELLCVQDEKGAVYVVDPLTGEVTRKVDFGDSGDYEGIEVAGEEVYVLESKGDLFRIRNFGKENQKVKQIETALKRKNDAEGLSLGKPGQLLIACKEESGLGEDNPGFRAVYAYNLETKELDNQPVVLLPIDKISEKVGLRQGEFKPSALAQHPESLDWYVLSTVDRILAVFSEDWELRDAVRLPAKPYKQPEGIAFRSNGDLYISNEAGSKDSSANLLYFRYQPTSSQE